MIILILILLKFNYYNTKKIIKIEKIIFFFWKDLKINDKYFIYIFLFINCIGIIILVYNLIYIYIIDLQISIIINNK